MIRVVGLEHRYRRRSERLFGGLDYTFAAGSMTGISGVSGAGKSTLLYILGLMLTPSNGEVAWDGVSVSSLSDRERSRLRAQRVGFVFQDSALDTTRTVIANVMAGALYAGFGRLTARQRAETALVRLGVEVPGTARPGQVSGGQAHRIGLARALVKDPDVVLADEPTGNLDATNGAAVLSALSAAAHGGAVVVIASHEAEVLSQCSRVLELR